MRPVNSIIEFKQIIGRGTRVFDGKDYFTVYDFVGASKNFSDPSWDGEPICEKCEQAECECEKPSPHVCSKCDRSPCECEKNPCKECGESPCKCNAVSKVTIELAEGKALTIQHMMQTSFWSPDGKPMSAEEFIRGLYGQLPDLFKNEAELRRIWSHPDTRTALLEGLSERGFSVEALKEIGKLINAEKSDIFDVLSHIAYLSKPISRKERVEMQRDRILQHCPDNSSEFLDFVLDHYVKEGFGVLANEKLTYLIDLKYHSIQDAVSILGEPSDIRELFISFQQHLFEAA
jgi:type I restriction enzyme R subunit